MGEKTEIAWTDSTHNEWLGCMKVSAGCNNCYAETMMDKRYHRVSWGQRKTDDGPPPSVGTRSLTSEANRRKPFSWNRKASAFQAEHGRRQRVFCSSLSDIFDNQVPRGWRVGLFNTIANTPELDWLLLTKRPENIGAMIDDCGWFKQIPRNVWLGTTCEDQAAYDKRWPILAQFNVRVRFISYEPAIGPLSILDHKEKPDWLICGGESGKGYRPMPSLWAEDIQEECAECFVPFFMKQMAGLRPIPEDLMIRQFPPSIRQKKIA